MTGCLNLQELTVNNPNNDPARMFDYFTYLGPSVDEWSFYIEAIRRNINCDQCSNPGWPELWFRQKPNEAFICSQGYYTKFYPECPGGF